MKRLFCILLTFVMLVGALCISAFAASDDELGTTDYESGRLYRKIIHWQNYVSSSVNNGTNLPNWQTTIRLPTDSLWEIHDGGGSYGTYYYTNSTRFSRPLNSRDRLVTWSTPYYISLEDISASDENYLRVWFESDLVFDVITVYAYTYDMYKNLISIQELGSFQNGSLSFNEAVKWKIDTTQATYMRFFVDMSFRVDENNNYLELYNFNWQISLPYEYDPLRFAVDGIDAWMNGYFKPNVPNFDGETDTWEYFFSKQVFMGDIYYYVKERFAYYLNGFRAWSYMFGLFFTIGWVKDILYSCFAIGVIAFLLDVVVQAVNYGKRRGPKSGGRQVDKPKKSKGKE